MTRPKMPIIRVNMKRAKRVAIESSDTTLPATAGDLLILAEKLTEVEVSLKVLLQALAIAAYDSAAAFRYADNYLKNRKNPHQREDLLLQDLRAVQIEHHVYNG